MIIRRHEPYLKLKSFFAENNIKQKDVAELIDKSPSAFNQKIMGTGGDFSLPEVRTICKKYKISADIYFLAS